MTSKKTVIKVYILLFVLFILIGLLTFIDGYAHDKIPNIYEIKAKNNNGDFLSFADFSEFSVEGSSVYKEIYLDIDNGLQDEFNIKTVLTNEEYADNYKMKLIAGSFFDKTMLNNNEHYMIISEDLSLLLFLNINSVGKELYIEGYKYTIIGIYESDNSVWGDISKDFYERIYIPYTSISNSNELIIDALAFKDNEHLFENVDKLSVINPNMSSNFERIDFIEKKNCATQFIPMIIFFMKTALILIIFLTIYRTIKSFAKYLYRQRNENYLIELFKRNAKKLIIVLIIFVFGIIASFFIIRSLKFPIVISSSVIPDDNLFDLGHYIEKALYFFQYNNTHEIAGNKFAYSLVNRTILMEMIISILIYISGWTFYRHTIILTKKDFFFALELLWYIVLVLLGILFVSHYFNSTFKILFTKIGIIFIVLTSALVLSEIISCYVHKKIEA